MPPRIRDHPVLVVGLALLLSLVWVRGFVFPLDGLRMPAGDELLMVWNLWHANDALTHGRNVLFAPHIYHPIGAWLGMHTYSPGFWPITFLTDSLTRHEPLYALKAYHLCLWVSFALALALTYLFLRRLGCSRFAALVPALQFAFSPFARWHVPHLQHLSFVFILPLASIVLLAAYRTPRPRAVVLLAAVLGIAVYFSEMSLYLWIAILLLVAAGAALRSTRSALLQALNARPRWSYAAAALVFLLILTPFLLAWGSHAGHAPKRRQTDAGSANLTAFVFPHSASTPLYAGAGDRWSAPAGDQPSQTRGIGGYDIFLGYPLLAFAFMAVVRRPRGWLLIVAGITASFLVLSLGPALIAGKWATGWPMPYALLMKIPPFHISRTPGRNAVFVLWGVVILAAHGLTWFERWLAGRGRGVSIVGRIGVLVWAALEVYACVDPAPSYRPPAELRALPNGPVVNVPLSAFDGYGVFLQTIHRQPIVTGFVSRRTPDQERYIRGLDRLLAEDPEGFVARMKEIGVRSVILGPGTLPENESAFRDQHDLRVIDLRRPEGLAGSENAPLREDEP